MQTNNIYLKIINFNELSLWDVKRYIADNLFDDLNYISLKDIFKTYQKRFNKKNIKEKGYGVMKKINFGGELFLRNDEEIKDLKGELFEVPENSIIYSKINLRHGCLYFHKKGEIPFGVSSEYPVFNFDDTKYNGEYLKMILRTQKVKNHLNSLTTGISKARIKATEFLDIKIPLPSLEKQNEIVELYNNKLKDSLNAENKALELEKEIESYLMSELGIEVREKEEKKVGLNFVEFKDLDIWGFENTYLTLNNIFKNTKYKKYIIENLCDIGSGGTPNRSNNDYYGGNIPWIKTGEVRENIIYDTEEKITQKGLENSSAKIFPKGSLILAMYGATAGRTAKLGIDLTTNQACAVLYNIDNSIIDTDFLWLYLQSQIENFKFISTGSAQPNLSAEKIKRYPLPLPPLEIQEKIVKHIGELKDEIKRLKSLSEELKESAKIEFEREIFM